MPSERITILLITSRRLPYTSLSRNQQDLHLMVLYKIPQLIKVCKAWTSEGIQVLPVDILHKVYGISCFKIA